MQLRGELFIQMFIPIKNQPSEEFSNWLVFNCGPTWARTRDPLIMSQVL